MATRSGCVRRVRHARRVRPRSRNPAALTRSGERRRIR
ncbi:hypothetical protein Ae168Ps1_0717c [Pseudonocardia sp. Ae168_Ps1]|nr:hypothetical protein Ae168Ps1_0717c [Pseudonocardia sp. Ae168_Ps1]